MAEFDGKVVVITGAASGIGRSTALAFAREGAKLHLADVNAEQLDAVKGECEQAGARATTHLVDVADADAVAAFAQNVYEQDGAVDILHNNAGIGHAGAIEDTPLEDWRRVIDVNLMGVVHGVHFFVPRMLEQGRPAHIVNTASMAGIVASPKMGPYCTSKYGVVGLSETLDGELGQRGIRVTALCPGVIDTAIIDTTTMRGAFAKRKQRLQKLYHTRGTSPDVVAQAVMRAVRRKQIVTIVPRYQVGPSWIATRISPRLGQGVGRLVMRVASR